VAGQSSPFLIPHLRPTYRMGLSSGPSVAINVMLVNITVPKSATVKEMDFVHLLTILDFVPS
jgi:hypothetical protein